MPLLKLKSGRLSAAVEEARVEVSLEDWREGRANDVAACTLLVPNDADVEEFGADIGGFGRIILDFPHFKDGRAYSQARLLRERFGFAGEIRARGDVLRDQIGFMARCGVDAFEMENADAEAVSEAFEEFSFVYQTSADGAAPVWKRRLDRAAAA